MKDSPQESYGQYSIYKTQCSIKKSLPFLKEGFKCCRGRARTFTGQLAVVQSSVVDPGRPAIANETALCYVYPVIPTPETRGHVCHAFAISSPHSVCVLLF